MTPQGRVASEDHPPPPRGPPKSTSADPRVSLQPPTDSRTGVRTYSVKSREGFSGLLKTLPPDRGRIEGWFETRTRTKRWSRPDVPTTRHSGSDVDQHRFPRSGTLPTRTVRSSGPTSGFWGRVEEVSDVGKYSRKLETGVPDPDVTSLPLLLYRYP